MHKIRDIQYVLPKLHNTNIEHNDNKFIQWHNFHKLICYRNMLSWCSKQQNNRNHNKHTNKYKFENKKNLNNIKKKHAGTPLISLHEMVKSDQYVNYRLYNKSAH